MTEQQLKNAMGYGDLPEEDVQMVLKVKDSVDKLIVEVNKLFLNFFGECEADALSKLIIIGRVLNLMTIKHYSECAQSYCYWAVESKNNLEKK